MKEENILLKESNENQKENIEQLKKLIINMKQIINEKNLLIDNLNGKEASFSLRIKTLNHENKLLKDKMDKVNNEVIFYYKII